MSARPLAGVTVVDLSRYLPGPLAAHQLACLGARVIKVEEPELGDPVRWAPPRKDGLGALAAPLLAGLESIALDLKKPAPREILRALLEDADVLLETFRPGGLARLGLDPQELRRRFPRLVICSLSGWGQEGPLAQRAGHDLTYQAIAGSLAPTAAVPSFPGADVLGAAHAVSSILAALYERRSSGRGEWIDAALFDAALHANLVAWAAEAGSPRAVGEPHDLSGALPAYHLYRTADDGWVALSLLERHFWRRMCKALGRRDLRRAYLSRSPEVREELAALFRQRSRRHWAELFARHDLPAEVVLSPAEALRHPQARARGVLGQGSEGLPRLAFPARFGGQRPRAGDAFPELGEHTGDVLAELPGELPGAGRRRGIGRRRGWRQLVAKLLLRNG